MQRSVVLTALGAMFLATLLWSVDAWARAGGGGSSGSRGRAWRSRRAARAASPLQRAPTPVPHRPAVKPPHRPDFNNRHHSALAGWAA